MIRTRYGVRLNSPTGTGRQVPRRGMILAAGLGRRMRPVTDTIPKPLVRVGGMTLLDRNIALLRRSGVDEIVVNVHYLGDQIERHLARYRDIRFHISDERERLLDSGGGVRHALHHFEGEPFLLLNADSFWIEGYRPNFEAMAEQWDAERMDFQLLIAGMANTVGYAGMGDFMMDPHGKLERRAERLTAPFVYAGAAIVNPAAFSQCPEGPFSLNLLFDRALERERLYGVRLDGLWFHVGTPDSILEAEQALAMSAA